MSDWAAFKWKQLWFKTGWRQGLQMIWKLKSEQAIWTRNFTNVSDIRPHVTTYIGEFWLNIYWWWEFSIWNWWWRLDKLIPRPESKGGRLVSRQWSIQDWSNLPMITIVESRDDPHTDDHERLLLQTNLFLTPRVVSVVDHNQTRFIWTLLVAAISFHSHFVLHLELIKLQLKHWYSKVQRFQLLSKVLMQPHSLA